MKKEKVLEIGKVLLRKKAIVVIVLVTLLILFFDNESAINWLRHKSAIKDLEAEKAYYQQKIDNDKRRINELNSNKASLEKFAREQFMMKRKKEDIFMLIEE